MLDIPVLVISCSGEVFLSTFPAELVELCTIRSSLVNLSYYSVSEVADGEFEFYLGFAGSVAEDLLVARLLARTDHPAEEGEEDRVEDSGFTALIQSCD